MTGATHRSASVVTPKATVATTGVSAILPADASVVTPFLDPTLQGVASASSGVAAFSSRVSIKNAIAFLVAAASEIFSNSTSSLVG